jgi:hypothetical protein
MSGYTRDVSIQEFIDHKTLVLGCSWKVTVTLQAQNANGSSFHNQLTQKVKWQPKNLRERLSNRYLRLRLIWRNTLWAMNVLCHFVPQQREVMRIACTCV